MTRYPLRSGIDSSSASSPTRASTSPETVCNGCDGPRGFPPCTPRNVAEAIKQPRTGLLHAADTHVAADAFANLVGACCNRPCHQRIHHTIPLNQESTASIPPNISRSSHRCTPRLSVAPAATRRNICVAEAHGISSPPGKVFSPLSTPDGRHPNSTP